MIALQAASNGRWPTAGSLRTLALSLRSSEGSSVLSLGVTPPGEIDLHVVVGVSWPDREDVHAAHTLQVE